MHYRQTVGAFGPPDDRPRRRIQIGDVVRSHATVIAIGVGLLICGLCFLYLWQGTTLLDLTAQCTGARDKLAEIEETNTWLKLKIEEAFSLERVSRIAREQLGMMEPMTVRYVQRPTDPEDG